MIDKENMRAIKFVLFSISAGVIQAIVDVIMNEAVGTRPWISSLVALVASVLWNFTFNRKFTFKSAGNVPVAMLKVALFYVVFAPLSSWWTKLLTENCHWNEYLVLGITMAVNLVTEYFYQRYFVFKNSIDTAEKGK